MKFYYLNSEGVRLNFYDSPYLIVETTLLDYSYAYEKKKKRKHEKICNIKKEVEEKEVEILIITDKALTLEERKEQFSKTLNRIYEVIECDVCAGTNGRICTDSGYYLEGLLLKKEKGNMFHSGRYVSVKFKFVTDYPYWCKEKTYSFKASTKEIMNAQMKEEIDSTLAGATVTSDYPWDYEKDYKSSYKAAAKRRVRDFKYDFYRNHMVGKLDNDHYAASDFRMIVYGPCTKPFIQIGGNIYEIFTTLYDSEYLVVDSRACTIKKYTRYGEEENILNSRSREYYIFEKIPAGKLTVKWNAQYAFDVVLYQERSEPAWK